MFYLKVAKIFFILKWQELLKFVKEDLIKWICMIIIFLLLLGIVGSAVIGLELGIRWIVANIYNKPISSDDIKEISGWIFCTFFMICIVSSMFYKLIKNNWKKAVQIANE